MLTSNAILVYSKDGVARHRFCPADEAKAALDTMRVRGEGGSTFTVDLDDAKLLYDTSPDLRERVESAKVKLQSDLRLQASLDAHGVPKDVELRRKVYAAINHLLNPQ